MNKKITSSALAALMIAGTTSFSAFASMSIGTVVIGTKAFDINYVNDDAHVAEITNAILAGGTIYVKDFNGNWIDNVSGLQVAASMIPAVTYKSVAGVETKFDAMDMDAVTTLAVASVSAVNNTRVDVALTTAVTSVDKSSFLIKDASGNALTVNSATLSADGKSVKVMTAAQTANVLYTMTVSALDYKFVGVPVDTVKPTLSSAVATKNTKVKLVFSKNVDINALDIANYSIAGLPVLNAAYDVDVNGDAVKTAIVLTTASQVQGSIYKVVVSNVADMSGNAIDTTLTTNAFQFGGLAINTTKPVVSSAVALTNTTVKVQFSETMDVATAENIANYSIAGLNVLKATLSSDMTYVTLKTVTQVQGTIYKVVVANVKDESANVIDSTLTTNSFQFGGIAVDTTKPTVSSAVALSNTTVKVQFSKMVDATTAENAANYTIAGLTVTKAVLDSTSGDFVTLTTLAQNQGNIYKVIVANVADASGNVIDSTLTTNAFQFGGLALDSTKPTIAVASSVDNKTVKVIFSEPVDTITATRTYNYYLGTSLGYPSSVIMDSSDSTGKTVLLTTPSQTTAVYTLAVNGVADLSGNLIDTTLTSSKATFGGTIAAADTVKPTLTSAVALDNNTVSVTFSKPMQVTSAETAVNYAFTAQGTETGATHIAGTTPTAVVLSEDGKTATMQFAAATMTSGVVYTVTATGLKDTNATPNNIDTTANTSLFAGITNANPAPKVAAAQVVNNSTLKITFTEPVTEAGLLDGTDFALSTVSGTAFASGTFGSATMSADNKSVMVYYTAPTFTGGSIYSVRVTPSKFTDALNVASLSSAVVSGTTQDNDSMFAGISAVATTPKISSAIAVDVNTLDVTFDQAVVSTLGIGDITVAGATVAMVRADGTNGNKVRIFFTGTPFTAGSVYTVNLDQTKVVNMNGTSMVAVDNNALFAAVSTANAKPAIVSVTKTSATTLKVVFSEKVGAVLGGAATGADFTLVGGVIGAGSETIDSADTTGKTVILTITSATAGVDTLTTTGTGITDEAGVGTSDNTVTVSFVY